MPGYAVAISKAGVNVANTVMWQVKTSASVRCRIMEMGIFVTSAPTTAPMFCLARSTALGTSTTTTLGQAEDAADVAALGTFDSAWSSAPTFTTTGPFLRLAGLPVTAGSGIIWTWGPGYELIVPASAGLCIANINASGSTVGNFVCYMKWRE
jgi:hypothetical protein